MKLTLKKLFILIVLAALLPTVLMSFFSYRQAKQSSLQILKSRDLFWARSQSDELHKLYLKIQTDLEILANLTVLQTIPQKVNWQSARFKRWIKDIENEIGSFYIRSQDYYKSICLFAPEGKVLFSISHLVHRRGGITVFVDTEVPQTLPDLIPVKSAASPSAILLSAPFRTEAGYVVAAVVPINGQQNYTLVLFLKLEQILNEKYRHFKDSQVENVFVTSKHDTFTWASFSTHKPDNSLFNYFIQNPRKGYNQSDDQSIIQWNDEPFLLTTIFIPSLHIYLHKSYALKNIWQVYQNNLQRNILIIILSALATIFFIFLFSRRIFNAINHIISGVEQIASGNLSYHIQIDSGDELQILAVAFSKLQGRLQQMVANIREMNKQVLEKEKLKELNSLKSQFISHVSHELRTPLTAIRWAVDNMLSGVVGSLQKEQKEYLQEIQKTSEHISRIIEDLLDLSRIEAGRLEIIKAPVSVKYLTDSAEHLLRPLAQQKNIHIKIKYDTAGLAEQTLTVDAERIIQILKNLLHNAVKFSPENTDIQFTVSASRKWIHFAVRDYGPGLAEEDLKLIFTRFYKASPNRSAEKGLGLGLAISQELARLHGGKIKVRSKLKEGSEFILSLLLKDETAAVKQGTPEKK